MTICAKCKKRIWKSEDGGPHVDPWFGSEFSAWHIHCNTSIEARRAEVEAMKRPNAGGFKSVPARKRGD